MLNPYLDPNPYFEQPEPIYAQQGDTSVPPPKVGNPYLPQEPVYAPPTQAPQLNQFERGVLRGIRGLAPSIDNAQSAVQASLGFEEAAEANLAEARQAEQVLAANERLRPRISRFRDVQNLADFGDWAASTAGETLPLIGTMAATGAVGGAAGALAGAGRVAGAITGMAPYWISSVGETQQALTEDPNSQGTLQEKSIGALVGGTAKTALGALPLASTLGKVLRPGVSLGQRVGSSAAVGALTEGATEGVEEAIGKLTHQQFNPQVELNSREAWLDYLDAAAGGALVGGAFGGGGALASHPFLAKAAQRDPDGPMGFAQKHRRLFGDQDLETLGSLSPEQPRSKLQAKMWEIEDRQNLDLVYQDLLGFSRKDYEAKRLDAERMLDDFAFGLYTNSLDANNPQTKQLAQAYQSDKALRGIVDQYIKENKQDWDAMPDWRVGPEGRVPLKSEFEQPLVRERGGQQDNAEQEGFGSDLAFGDRQGVNKGKDDLTSSSGDFFTPAGGLPWKSAEAAKRDNPNFDPAIIDETTNQFTEREMVRFLPVEGQQSYEAARKAGALPEWRRARQQEGDEWGAILNNQELRPVSLRTMLEEEYDTQDPERIAEIVRRDYLSNQNAIKGKDAAAKRAQYEADPLAYADDYMVVRKTRLPNLISGRDEFTPTERELIPEVRPRDAQAMQSKRAQAQALRSTYDEVLWDGFSDQEKGFLQEFGKLEDKFVDVGRKMPVEEKAKYRSLYQENKDLVDFYRTRRADLYELTKEAKALEKEAQNIDYQTKPVIDDFDPDKEAYVKGDKTNFQQTAAKRIPILVRDQRSGEWLKRSIDPMQLILQEQSQKGNFSKSPDTFIDEMANALHSGLAGILANPSLEVRLPTGRDPQTKKYTFAPDDPKAPKYIDPETIVYSRRNGGVQFKWKDLNAAPGFDRLKSALGSIREQKLKARDAEQRQSLGFAETDTIAKLRNYPEGADLIAQQSLAELPQQLEKEKMLRLGQQGLTAEQKQQIEVDYAQKLSDKTGRIELQRLKDRARIEARQEREEDETRFDSREMTAEVGTGAEWETGQAKTTPGNNKWSDDMPKEDQVYTFDKDSKRIPAEEVKAPLPGQWEGMRARAARRAQGLPETAFGAVDEPPEATRTTYPQTETQTFGERDQTGQETKPFAEKPVTDFASLPIEGYADPRTLPPAEARLYAADSIRQQENPAAAAQGKREAMQRITRKFGDKPWIVRRELAKAEARYYYDMEVITERQEQARQAGQREPQPIEFDAEGNRKPRPVSEAPPTTPRIYAITLPSGRTRVATPEEADVINRTIQLQRGPNTAEEAPAAPTRNRLKDLQKIRQDEKKVGRAYIGPSGSKLAYYEFSPDTQSWETHKIPLVRGALDATTGSNTLKRQTEMNVTAAPDAPSSGAVTDPFGTEVPPGITATQPELRQGPTPGGVVSTASPAYREAPKADTGPLRLGIKPQLGPPVPDPTSPTGLREGPRIHFDTGKLIFDPPPREEKPQGSGVAATGAYRDGQAPQPPTPPQYEPLVINEDKVADYYGRTKISADKAEVTLAMAMDYGTAGEGLTKRLAGEKLVKWQPRSALTPFADAVVAQLKQSKGKTLNIAGNALGNWAKFTDKNKKPITQEHVNWAVYKVLKHIKENYPQLERVVTGGQTGTDIAGAIAARALGIPVEVNMPKGFRQEGQFSQTKDKVLRQIEDGAAKINEHFEGKANGLRTEETQQAPDPAPAAVAEKPAEPSAPRVTRQARIARNDLKQNANTLYVFGDNDQRQGYGGQAAAMRGEPNAVGIRTKAKPLRGADAYWSDATYAENIRKIDEDMARLFAHQGPIVLPEAGIGTGLAELKQRAPKTFQYLQERLADLEQGRKPSAPQTKSADYIEVTIAKRNGRQIEADLSRFADATSYVGEQRIKYARSPWLSADGRVVSTGGDHIDYSDALGYEGYADLTAETGAVRTGLFVRDENNSEALITLHLLEGQTLTPAQKSTVERFVTAHKAQILLGVQPKRKDGSFHPLVNPEYQPVSLDQLPTQPQPAPQPQPQLSATARSIRNKFVQSLKGKTPEQMRGVAAAKRAEAKTANDYKRQFLLTDADIAERMANGEDVKFSATLDIPGLTTDADLVRHQAAEAKLRRADLQREERFANELLKKLGLQRTVRLATVAEAHAKRPDKLGAHGMKWTDADGTVRIYLNPLLSKAVRLETLGHELGHIVFKDALSQADASTQKAIKQAFEAWRDGAKASRSLKAIYDSKKTAALLDSLWGFDGQTLDSLSAEDQAYVLDFEEWFADNVGRWMVSDAKPVGLVQQFFKDVADLLRDLFRLLHGNQPDAAVKKYLDSLFVREEPVSLATTPGATSFTPAERKVLGQAFRAEHVQRQLRKLLENDPVALDQLRDPDAAIAYGYQFWLQGSLSVGPRTQTAFQRLLKATKDTLGEVDEGTQAEAILRAPGANAHKAQLTDTAVQRGYAKLKGQSAKLMEVLRKVAFMGHEQIKALDNPYTDRLAELIYNEAGTEGVAEGYLSATTRRTAEFLDRLNSSFDGQDKALGSRVLDLLTKRADLKTANAAERKLVREVYQLLGDLRKYAEGAKVDLGFRGKTIDVDGVPVNDYFPRAISVDKLMANRDQFLAMLKQPKYADKVSDPEAIYRAYLENFGIETEFDPNAVVSPPQASSFKKRDFAWIEDEDIAPYLTDDLGDALSGYIYQAVRRSEWLRRFNGEKSRAYQKLQGQKGVSPEQLAYAKENGGFVDLLEDAKATGLTADQEERVNLYVQGVLGTLGSDINPTLNTIQSWMLVVQNLALLGLSTITSLADIAGLAVRGDMQTAWEGLRAGLREVVALAKQEKTELKKLGEALGTIEKHAAIDALGMEYGGYRLAKGPRRINEMLFRFNLLQSFTRGTRLMALASAQTFIAKHVQNPDKNSRRFLEQLNLHKGDVTFDQTGNIKLLSPRELDQANAAERARDARVRAALNQFVDESILRPSNAERPIWANDPKFLLAFHLKQWMYSFNAIILRRVVSESIEGNFAPMLRLGSYIPLTMAAIALKDLLRGDDGDEPKEWTEQVSQAIERSGILGFGQVFLDVWGDEGYGKATGSSLLDPTSSSLIDLVDAILSDSETDDARAVERFMPLQSVWRDW